MNFLKYITSSRFIYLILIASVAFLPTMAIGQKVIPKRDIQPVDSLNRTKPIPPLTVHKRGYAIISRADGLFYDENLQNYITDSLTIAGLSGECIDTQYVNAGDSLVIASCNGDTLYFAHSPGVTDHGALTGLADDDHMQYALLAGRGNAQTLTGGVTTIGSLRLRATAGIGNTSSVIQFQVGNNGAINAGYIGNDGKWGLGTTGAPTTSKLMILSSTEQLRSAYNTSNYFTAITGSTGGTTFNAVGSSPAFDFSDNVSVNAKLKYTIEGGAASTLAGRDGSELFTDVQNGGGWSMNDGALAIQPSTITSFYLSTDSVCIAYMRFIIGVFQQDTLCVPIDSFFFPGVNPDSIFNSGDTSICLISMGDTTSVNVGDLIPTNIVNVYNSNGIITPGRRVITIPSTSSVTFEGGPLNVNKGNYNTFLSGGNNTLTGDFNTMIGAYTGIGLTTGGFNTAVGLQAGYNLVNGQDNTLVGLSAGQGITSGITISPWDPMHSITM